MKHCGIHMLKTCRKIKTFRYRKKHVNYACKQSKSLALYKHKKRNKKYRSLAQFFPRSLFYAHCFTDAVRVLIWRLIFHPKNKQKDNVADEPEVYQPWFDFNALGCPRGCQNFKYLQKQSAFSYSRNKMHFVFPETKMHSLYP